jgi:hypothetical protein
MEDHAEVGLLSQRDQCAGETGMILIRAITARRLLSPHSFARIPFGVPYGQPSLMGGIRVYRVPR